MKLAVVSYYEQDGGIPIDSDDNDKNKNKKDTNNNDDNDKNKKKDNCVFNNPLIDLNCKKKRNCFICSLS